jgi:hypothetical protein
MRAEGFVVIVEPDNGTKLCYLTEKGIREFLSDPICLLILGIPITLILNLASAWLYDQLKRPCEPDETKIVLEFDDKGNRVRYSQSGQPISNERFSSILASLDNRKRQFQKSQEVVSPYAVYVFPIHLEHTGKIVGWSKGLIFDDHAKAIRLDSTTIIDDETWERIQKGELQGFSVAGIVCGAICSVCGEDYTDCNHIAGRTYTKGECIVRITKLLPAEISIVREPVQPLAKIEFRK